MTVIVALVEDDVVWMGGDSAGVCGHALTTRKDPKVFRLGQYQQFLVGFTSSFRMGQLLRWQFLPPSHSLGTDSNEKYMNMYFVEKVRECLKEGGYAKVENNSEEGGTFIVGYRGEIFTIGADFQVGSPRDNFAAVGCGHHLALGSLATTEGFEIKPLRRIILALTAAERYSSGVRRPFLIINSKGEEWKSEDYCGD